MVYLLNERSSHACFSTKLYALGILAWTILGTISAVVMMYGHYHKDMPLKPRTLLYPIFGEKLRKSLLGTIIDAAAIIAVAAGTIGPIDF